MVWEFWHVTMIITQWLNYVDSKALCYALPRFGIQCQAILAKKFNQSFDRALQNHNINCQQLRHLLSKHNVIVSGSFLLHVLYEEEAWEPLDIDLLGMYKKDDPFIFDMIRVFGQEVNVNEEKRCLDGDSLQSVQRVLIPTILDTNDDDYTLALSSEGVPKFSRKRSHCRMNDEHFALTTVMSEQEQSTMHKKHYEYRQDLHSCQNRQYPHGLPISSRTFHFSEHFLPINYIHVCVAHPYSVPRFISNFFDVDFCKLAYDSHRLSAFNWDSLFTRSSCVDWNHYKQQHSNYYRGPDPPCGSNLEKWFVSRLQHRKKKYTERGFQIFLDQIPPTIPWVALEVIHCSSGAEI